MKKAILVTMVVGLSMSSAHAVNGFHGGFGYHIDNVTYEKNNYEIKSETLGSFGAMAGFNLTRLVGVEVFGKLGAGETEPMSYEPCDPDNLPEDDSGNTIGACEIIAQERMQLNYGAGANLKVGLPISKKVTLIGKYGLSLTEIEISREIKNTNEEDPTKQVTSTDGRNSEESKKEMYRSNNYGVGFAIELPQTNSQFEIMYNMFNNTKDFKNSSIQLQYNMKF